MKIRIVKHDCADGVERGILEYRNHWWEKWKPLHQDGKLAYVSYMGTKPYKSLQEECFDVLGLNEEQIKVREQMFRYILPSKRFKLSSLRYTISVLTEKIFPIITIPPNF